MSKTVYKNAKIHGRLCDIEVVDGVFTKFGEIGDYADFIVVDSENKLRITVIGGEVFK